MKKKIAFLMPLLLLILFAGKAQNIGDEHYAISELSMPDFRKLVVNANIDVVLIQNDTLRKAYIEGDEKLVSCIAVTVVKGTMTIAAHGPVSYRGKVQVTVAVKELSKLEINADAGIVSFSPLRSPELAVNINGYCDIHLKSTGKILLEAGDGYDIRYNEQGNSAVLVSGERTAARK